MVALSCTFANFEITGFCLGLKYSFINCCQPEVAINSSAADCLEASAGKSSRAQAGREPRQITTPRSLKLEGWPRQAARWPLMVLACSWRRWSLRNLRLCEIDTLSPWCWFKAHPSNHYAINIFLMKEMPFQALVLLESGDFVTTMLGSLWY